MARGREVPFEDKVAIKTLRESGHSFGGVAKTFGYSKSEAYKGLKLTNNWYYCSSEENGDLTDKTDI